MKETGILMTPENHRRILSGDKTQTRRVMKSHPSEDFLPDPVGWYAPTKVDRDGEEYPDSEVYGVSDENEGYIFPYGVPGDHLYIKEGVIL